MTSRSRKTTDLYLARIPEEPAYRPVLPEERQAQIEATRNDRTRAQRYTAWDTLQKGLLHSRKLTASEADLKKNETGKWTSARCGISISHCNTAVAAAVSDGAVGVDLELAEDPRCREALLNRIATDAERELFKDLPTEQRIAALWTRKEAAFKRGENGAFSPIVEDAAAEDLRTILIRLDRAYLISVAAKKDAALRVFEVQGESITERMDFETLDPNARR